MRITRIFLSLFFLLGFALHAQRPQREPQPVEESQQEVAQGSRADLNRRPMTQVEVDFCLSQFNEFGQAQQMMSSAAGSFQESKLPLGASDVAPQVTQAASLITGEKDGRGVATYSLTQQISTGRTNDWALSVSVPFNKSEGQAVFASLNGLSGDVVANLAFSSFIWDLEPKAYGAALCRVCQELNLSLKECFPENVESILKERGQMEEAIGSLEDKLFGTASAWFWGLDGSVGRKERSFFEPTGDKSKEDRLNHSFSLNGGWLFKSGHLYLKGTRKRDYRDKASATLCTPITGSVLESCSSLPLGEADQVDSTVASAEYRQFFPRLAVSPSAQFDFEESIWGFQLPVFLTRDGNGKFTGGVRFAWRSDERDLITTVFVSRGLEGVP